LLVYCSGNPIQEFIAPDGNKLSVIGAGGLLGIPGDNKPWESENYGYDLNSKMVTLTSVPDTFVRWDFNPTVTLTTGTPTDKVISFVLDQNITVTPITTVATAHTVTFNSMGGTAVSSQNVESDGLVTQPDDPVKGGYTFVEWQLSGVAYNFSTPVTSNLTLVAVYRAVGTTIYTVSFNSTGGTDVPSQTVNKGDSVAQPEAPVKEGYTFVEWRTYGVAYDFSKPVTSNLTLFAFYKPIEIKSGYTVTFNSTGGTDVPSQTVDKGDSVAQPEAPVKEGYTFVEWRTYGVAYDFSKPVTSNLTLFAFYKPIEIKSGYTVTFNSTGGTDVPSQTVDKGGLVVQPEAPVKEGYNFIEWRTYGVAYDFSKPVTSSFTLYAFYEPIYTVTFNSTGGTDVPSQTVDKGGLVVQPEAPVKEGYTFVEWRTYGVAYDFSKPVTSNLTLFAFYR